MADREKVISEFEDFVNRYECFCTSDDYEYEMHKAVLALLKEQEHKDRMFHALEDDWKRLKGLLKEQKDKETVSDVIHETAKQFRQTIVRCKDCKHRDPEDKKCDCGHDIQWQLTRTDNWFCADGERK